MVGLGFECGPSSSGAAAQLTPVIHLSVCSSCKPPTEDVAKQSPAQRGVGDQGSEEFRYSLKVTRQEVVKLEPGLHPYVLSPHQ